MSRFLMAGILALAACGAPLPPARPLGAQSSPDANTACQDERSTGTNMSRSVCRTDEQVKENKRAAEEWEKHPRNSVTNAQ